MNQKHSSDFVVIKAVEDGVNVIGTDKRNRHKVSPFRKTRQGRSDHRSVYRAYFCH